MMKRFALPIGAFVLVLLGALMMMANKGSASDISPAPLTPPAQAGDSIVKVLPTPIAALPVNAIQVVPFTDAALARDILLDVSKAGPWDEPSNAVDIRDYPAWRTRFPNLGLSGYSVAADSRHVSVYRNAFDPKQAPSETNQRVLAFAVADIGGHCAAGALIGNPTYTTFGAVDIGGAKCKAQSVLDRLKH